MSHDTFKALTFVVPAYNMQEYLRRCVDSLVSTGSDDVEVLIVDDGSTDGTPALADRLEAGHPGVVRAIHQENKGHGGAVNTGIAQARGQYLKVVDADDWVGADSLRQLLTVMRQQPGDKTADEKADKQSGANSRTGASAKTPIDLFVTDYVYDKVGKRHKHVVNFRNVMSPGRRLAWDDLKPFGISQYMIMHALTFRTEVLRRAKTTLPEHTFYVDFIYAYQPFPWVGSLMYLSTPFYHYFIGREGQSVQTDVMIRRVNQLTQVNRIMAAATPERGTVPDGLYRYMIHFLSIESVVTSAFLILSRQPRNYAVKKELWTNLERVSPSIARDVRRQLPSRAINLRGPVGRWIIRVGYHLAERVIGFN
ncbi:glycosyltransferase family 2 protein [Bifidobacterium sp. ESL0763]|uniref:glycosyltransferase family 2 protein n=1 Tax=Bifidobacterium sp. ESL0763 TaxID=2983227 RepID=UPI0023F85B15|nr:glycosyltransferase family 2 protein [Bifidobacterium sp. ESL0763]MDF7664455.1 glycosyltransferase family 2 protein [Bifidobacterium sp. ESL0763]